MCRSTGFQGQATKISQRDDVCPFLSSRGWTLTQAELYSKAAFSGLIHAQGASTVCSRQTKTWNKRADELDYNFYYRFISSTNINYSGQTSEIWIKRP